MKMQNRYEEWLRQSDYDIETAKYMYDGGRFFYAVFMCHIAVEKALKGLYQKNLNELPPKTHNLIYLLTKMDIKPPDTAGRFLVKLNEASVSTRYPEDITILQKNFTEDVVGDIIKKTMELLQWIKQQF